MCTYVLSVVCVCVNSLRLHGIREGNGGLTRPSRARVFLLILHFQIPIIQQQPPNPIRMSLVRKTVLNWRQFLSPPP